MPWGITPKREEVTKECRKLYEEFVNLYLIPNIVRIIIQKE
jgi:hypothetical protein